jgi:hypothetical protein
MTIYIQDVLDLARLDLNDVEKTRNPDANMLRFANDGLAKLYTIRPDLRWGNYTTPFVPLELTDPFPLSQEYEPALCNYIVFRCETADDAFAIEQRAFQGMKLFLSDLGLG